MSKNARAVIIIIAFAVVTAVDVISGDTVSLLAETVIMLGVASFAKPPTPSEN